MKNYGLMILGVLVLVTGGAMLVKRLKVDSSEEKRKEQFVEVKESNASPTEEASGISEGEGVKLEVLDTKLEEGTVSGGGGEKVMTDEEVEQGSSEVDQLGEDLKLEEELKVEFKVD